jgi:hypothetical protein
VVRSSLKRPLRHGENDARWCPQSPTPSSCSSSSASVSDSAWPWKHEKKQRVAAAAAPPTMDLPMEFWVRTEECKELKSRHLDYIDRHYSTREDFIEDTVFCDPFTGEQRDIVLEPNMFPYETPADVEHWTLWSRADMSPEEVQAWVTAWLVNNKPDVLRWGWDDNAGDRSILWFHVHVYLQFDQPRPYTVLQRQDSGSSAAAAGEGYRSSSSCSSSSSSSDRLSSSARKRYGRSRRSRSPAPTPDPSRSRRPRYAGVKQQKSSRGGYYISSSSSNERSSKSYYEQRY